MDSNSICHKLDPSLILEMTSIIQENMQSTETLLRSLPDCHIILDPQIAITIDAIKLLCRSIYNTNSVLNTIIDIMVDEQLEEPTSNM